MLNPSKTEYTTGMITSVIKVELRRPPMTALAMGAWASPPSDRPNARGIRAKMVVLAVIRIGLSRLRPASMMASRIGILSRRRRRLVYQQNGVVDDDSAEHDTADVRLHIESGVGEEQDEDDTDGGQRNGKHNDKWITE